MSFRFLFTTFSIYLAFSWVAFAEPSALKRQLSNLANLKIDIDSTQLESGSLSQTYVWLEDQLKWTKATQGLLYTPDLAVTATNHLQQLIKQIQDFYKNCVTTVSVLGDPVAYASPDVIVILGANRNGLEQRLATALPLLNCFPRIPVILSGGGRSIHQEASFMRQFLVHRGIAANRLMEETDSVDTVGNAVFTGLLLKQKKIDSKNILLVTSDFHAPRALFLFRNILGEGRKIAVALARSPAEIVSARISSELKSQATSMESIFFYNKLPGAGIAQRVDDIESALYQLILQHDLYKNRWDLLRRYEKNPTALERFAFQCKQESPEFFAPGKACSY